MAWEQKEKKDSECEAALCGGAICKVSQHFQLKIPLNSNCCLSCEALFKYQIWLLCEMYWLRYFTSSNLIVGLVFHFGMRKLTLLCKEFMMRVCACSYGLLTALHSTVYETRVSQIEASAHIWQIYSMLLQMRQGEVGSTCGRGRGWELGGAKSMPSKFTRKYGGQFQ